MSTIDFTKQHTKHHVNIHGSLHFNTCELYSIDYKYLGAIDMVHLDEQFSSDHERNTPSGKTSFHYRNMLADYHQED